MLIDSSLFPVQKSISEGTTLLDTSTLTATTAEVVQLGTTYVTNAVYLDAVDEGRVHREDTLYADAIGDLTYSEALIDALTGDTDHIALEDLDTCLVTLRNAIVDRDRITALECGELLLGGKLLLDCLN